MLLNNSITKLAADKASFGEYVLTDFSNTKKIVITKFRTWGDLFNSAAAILKSSEFEASLDI